ncbi:CU044_5270 family protein [Streptomyces fagopyri]|uniref:CU044_5270 family protein n=1 Tax=Streptomyces fagopyri TaxID=2662397 RepID=UPI00382C3E12
MNEVTEIRSLREGSPLPDQDRLDGPRTRLMQAIELDGNRRWRAPRTVTGVGRSPRRRLLLVTAAVAAVATTGGVVARLPDGHSDGGREVLSAKASAAALELAAATVAKNDGTEPSAKQWVYEKSASLHGSKPQTSEEWTRWDGTGDARLPGIPGGGSTKGFDPNKLQVWYGPNQEEKWKEQGYDDRSQRQFYRFLATLPSDPDQMMRRILQEHAIGAVKGETRAERDWRELNVLFRSVLVPPKVQAGMFRALAKIPGARVEKGVKDPLGREALGVAVNYPHRTASGAQGKQEIFLDPKTYAYLGKIDHAAPLSDHNLKGAPGTSRVAGDTHNAIVEARVAWGVVDRPGTRP